MERSTRSIEAELEASHWWFEGRRRLLRGCVERLGLSPAADILDVGSGTGANLRMFGSAGYSRVKGVDPSRDAIEFCRRKNLGPVERAGVESLPFPAESFDLALCADVLEHIDDDRQASAALHRVLRLDGHLLLTVPAFASLWGPQDEVSHHRRRYRRAQVLQLLRETGFRVEQSFYFNYLLFTPIWLARRLLLRLPVKIESENALTPAWANALLRPLFALDVSSARYLRPPVGVSLLALARRL